MSSRRQFVGQILAGTATLAVSGFFPSSRVLGADERVRVGLIGARGRGEEILKAAIRCPNAEAVAFAEAANMGEKAAQGERVVLDESFDGATYDSCLRWLSVTPGDQTDFWGIGRGEDGCLNLSRTRQ